MNIRKYSGCHPNYDLNRDGIFPTYKAFSKAYVRYWRGRMLKEIYGLRNKVKLEEINYDN